MATMVEPGLDRDEADRYARELAQTHAAVNERADIQAQEWKQYMAVSDTWMQETHKSLRRSRAFAWGIALVSLGIAALAVWAVAALAPLKETQAVVLSVDKSTGAVHVMTELNTQTITPDEALQIADVANYVIRRETYDANDVNELRQYMLHRSTATEFKNYERETWDRSRANSKLTKYGRKVEIEVEIKAVTFLRKGTAHVRFLTRETELFGRRTTVRHWVSVVDFEYITKPASILDRIQNPVGFKVPRYRTDQEVFVKESSK